MKNKLYARSLDTENGLALCESEEGVIEWSLGHEHSLQVLLEAALIGAVNCHKQELWYSL